MMTLVADVETIVHAIWESMLATPIARGEDCLLDEESQLTAMVQITGAFDGTVMVQCPYALGAHLTTALLQTAGDPNDEEIQDAFGELSNMFAGNLKALLAKPSFISLPRVTIGPYDESSLADFAVTARVAFVSDGQPLIVTILERR
jgi:chemotaxis protein CheX